MLHETWGFSFFWKSGAGDLQWTYTGASISASMSRVLWYSWSSPVIVRSPQWMRRSADGRGDLNGGVGSPCSLELNGALWVSLMMRILVLMVEFDMVVVVNRDAKTKA